MINKKDLLNIFKSGEKEKSEFRIGVESEQFVFKNINGSPRRLSYDEPGGIKDLLLFYLLLLLHPLERLA